MESQISVAVGRFEAIVKCTISLAATFGATSRSDVSKQDLQLALERLPIRQ